ncbi:MAG: MCE family protein [Ignavibacteriales bacterium]|nr:MCE family protein [Ignavibacteriales bacterium]
MLKSLKGVRLGLFVFIGTVLLILAIFSIGSREALFRSDIKIKAYFSNIEGLKKGAPVRLSGYTIGSVEAVTLIPDKVGFIEVKMTIDESVKGYIRLDSEASIETEGLVGRKIITITPGSPDAVQIEDGGVIIGKEPTSVSRILSSVEDIVENTEKVTREFAEVIEKVNKGEGTFGKLVNNDDLYQATIKIVESADYSLRIMTQRLEEISSFIIETGGGIESIMGNVDSVVIGIRSLVENVEKGEGVLGALIADESLYDSIRTVIDNLVQTTDEAVKGSKSFVENMEALKHNWLFKGYFEGLGYWDTEEYEKNINDKIEELKEQNTELDKKINELKELEKKINKNQ